MPRVYVLEGWGEERRDGASIGCLANDGNTRNQFFKVGYVVGYVPQPTRPNSLLG